MGFRFRLCVAIAVVGRLHAGGKLATGNAHRGSAGVSGRSSTSTSSPSGGHCQMGIWRPIMKIEFAYGFSVSAPRWRRRLRVVTFSWVTGDRYCQTSVCYGLRLRFYVVSSLVGQPRSARQLAVSREDRSISLLAYRNYVFGC